MIRQPLPRVGQTTMDPVTGHVLEIVKVGRCLDGRRCGWLIDHNMPAEPRREDGVIPGNARWWEDPKPKPKKRGR